MAPDSQLRSAGLPSQKQVIELLDGEFARAGYDIEDVVIDDAARRITVVADGDQALDLDVVAQLARTASDLLTTFPVAAPGVLVDIAKAVVQVEFSPPNESELELAGKPAESGEANGGDGA